MLTPRPFYSGENVNLIVPTRAHAESSTWSDWFNSQRTTKFTTRGLMPNSVETQVEFQQGLTEGSRFALLICPTDSSDPIGIVSLSSIDHRRHSAAIAVIMDTETKVPHSPFASLEAMALVTEHGFEVLGLHRIDAGQVYPALERWNRLLELLGFRSEGFKRQAFRRGHEVSDEVVMGALYSDFLALKESRNGAFWPGSKAIQEEIRQLPAKGFASVLFEAYKKAERSYFS